MHKNDPSMVDHKTVPPRTGPSGFGGKKKDNGQTIFSLLWSKISRSTKLVSFFLTVQRYSPNTEESIHIGFNDIAQWHEIGMVA
jgi:hypothetical protein